VTGRRTDLSAGVSGFLARCRRATDLPLALGFGIKTPGDVRAAGKLADIAIVGTACLEAWERLGKAGYRDFLGELAAATASV
jgi:tryptophan synthase alpha chain